MRATILLLAASAPLPAQLPDTARMPAIDGEWWRVAGNPDLGELTSPSQQPVDFAVWQAADGTWQLWSCIRGTRCGGITRLFHGWEGESLTATDWRPLGITWTAETRYGETEGGMQAPHVVRRPDGTYLMLYGDWINICAAISTDGKHFERVVGPDGRTAVFSEGPGANTRDAMTLFTGGLWHTYYTAYPYEQGMVFARTSRDLESWSASRPVAYGGEAGIGPWNAECPFVFELDEGHYYLFRTQSYGRDTTRVYYSRDPLWFGINQDRAHLCGTLAVAAPEIIRHDGRDYIAALEPDLDGIRIARLKWERPRERWIPRIRGNGLFNFYRPWGREGWRVVEGDISGVFTTSRRQPWNQYYHQFASTGERADGPHDSWTGTIEGPEFTLEDEEYALLVGGGEDLQELYVALVLAETGAEIARLTGEGDYPMTWRRVDTGAHRGARAKIVIVDRKRGGWGTIHFGGMFRLY